MQLKGKKSIRNAVTTMTAALLGTGLAGAADQNHGEFSLLDYSETNGIRATEGIFSLNKQWKTVNNFGFKFTYDGLTGATPNGAVPSGSAQTFTRPSGRGSYVVPSGAIPLDHTFHDMRFAFDADVNRPLGRLTSMTAGAHVSLEHDYSSIGANTGLTQDFNRKNTTLGLSAAYSHDVVSPVGGFRVPFSSMPAATPGIRRGSRGGKPKNVYDAVLTLTQIIDRNTLFRMNYSFDRATGYLTDPYRLLSVVLPQDSAYAGDAADYLYENRPGSRNKNAVYAEMRRFLSGNAVDLSYRYFWDTWGIRAHTVEIFFDWQVGRDKQLIPHVRWYRQSQADFYHPFLVQGVPLPVFASADTRLAKFDALTLGLEYRFPVWTGLQMGVSAEYYSQMMDRSPPEAFGALRGTDLIPRTNALMVRLTFGHGL
jgi:hypothetical protein